MINYWQKFNHHPKVAGFLLAAFFLLIYLLTLAQTPVLGDPTEYTFVANILGIAHPPGYAFITVAGKLFQTLVPFGSIPWRMHLLSAAMGTLGALFVFGTVATINNQQLTVNGQQFSALRLLPAVFAALVVGTAVNYWQHAIHANPHIITAVFLAANLFFLTKWAYGGKVTDSTKDVTLSQKWLYAFCLSAGLGVTHHPLTVFAWPGYALFILVVWFRYPPPATRHPPLIRLLRVFPKMLAFALLGLSVWLYFPIRSPMKPAFGPSTMNTLNGFLDHVLARNLRVNLFYFGPADQFDRLAVFWSLLRLQYALPVIFLAALGLFWLAFRHKLNRRSRPLTPLLLLYVFTFLPTYLFVMNTVQDVMAYLLGPFLWVGLMAGIGLWGLLEMMERALKLERTAVSLLFIALFLLGPGLQIARNAPRVSLRDYDEGAAFVDAVFTQFDGQGQGVTLLTDWEHMTPLWYTQFVENRWPDPADVRPEFVSSARPWLDNVFDYLPGGPVYLSNYRRDVVDAGFRLRPSGSFYQVVEPGDASIPPKLTLVSAVGEAIEVVGYDLPDTVVAGDYIPFILAMKTKTGTDDFYVPVLSVGEMSLPFTTDSHLTTPNWQPGEVIVEPFNFALPHNLPSGEYPVMLNLINLSADEDIPLNLSLGNLSVTGQKHPISADLLLANFRQRVGLVSARVKGGDGRRTAPWSDPLAVRPGDTLRITLKWQALAAAEESYTVFVHLIDLANQPIAALDYTPLGGASPTHLWFPKWLPGQQFTDPYRLQIPPALPPGTYLIEVGLYEMVSLRRLHIADANGNLVGDRYILGSLSVPNP